MKAIKLPSGNSVLLPWKETQEQKNSENTVTAAAMVLDIDGVCPKCNSQMGIAIACSEDVYYCDNCRVSLPLRNGE